MASWTFVLTNQHFIPLGEILNMKERKVSVPLNALDTCSFRVLADNDLASQLMTCSGYVKGYRDGVLSYFGPIIGAEKVVEGGKGTVSVNSASQGWILSKRLILPDTTNLEKHTLASAADRAVRFVDFLEYERYSNEIEESIAAIQTGINNIDVFAASAASTAIYNVTEPKFLNVILSELAAGDGGFDWRFLPRENYINGAVQYQDTAFCEVNIGSGDFEHSVIADFYAAPTIGQLREEAIFEYGTGKHNVTGYKQVANREGQANLVHHYSVGQTPTIVSSEDGFWGFSANPVQESLGFWDIMEDLAEADINDTGLRTQLVSDHAEIRHKPRTTIDFTPVGSYNSDLVPQYGTDFGIGDIVRARAVDDFDALFRVWGAAFDIDDNGVEKMTLSLSEQGV